MRAARGRGGRVLSAMPRTVLPPHIAWRWPLLLLLLLRSRVAAKAEIETFQVQVLPEVRGFLGENVTLPCKLQTQVHDQQVTLVTWQRQDPWGVSLSVAVFHPTQGSSFPQHPSFPEPERLDFVAARPGQKLRDASLAVWGLRAEDEANYTCHIATFPHGSKSARTWLRVLAKPENEAETQEVPLMPLGQEPVPVARCVSRKGRPPARISWSLDGKVNDTQVLGPLPDGTYSVIYLLNLTPTSEVDGKNVTCTVEHETFEKPVLLPVTLRVPYPPEVSISGYDDNWYLGLGEAALNCDVRSNPEPTDYVWSTVTGHLPPSAVAQGSQLLIHSVDESVNTTFICSVTNALGTRNAEQTILVRAETPQDPSSRHLILNVVLLVLVPVLVLLCLGILTYFLRFRCSRWWNSRSPTANNKVSYSGVNCEASSALHLQTEDTR